MKTDKKRVFQYLVVLHKYDKDNNYEDTEMVIEPKIVLSKSEKSLVCNITREIPEKYTENPDNVEIIIRDF